MEVGGGGGTGGGRGIVLRNLACPGQALKLTGPRILVRLTKTERKSAVFAVSMEYLSVIQGCIAAAVKPELVGLGVTARLVRAEALEGSSCLPFSATSASPRQPHLLNITPSTSPRQPHSHQSRIQFFPIAALGSPDTGIKLTCYPICLSSSTSFILTVVTWVALLAVNTTPWITFSCRQHRINELFNSILDFSVSFSLVSLPP